MSNIQSGQLSPKRLRKVKEMTEHWQTAILASDYPRMDQLINLESARQPLYIPIFLSAAFKHRRLASRSTLPQLLTQLRGMKPGDFVVEPASDGEVTLDGGAMMACGLIHAGRFSDLIRHSGGLKSLRGHPEEEELLRPAIFNLLNYSNMLNLAFKEEDLDLDNGPTQFSTSHGHVFLISCLVLLKTHPKINTNDPAEIRKNISLLNSYNRNVDQIPIRPGATLLSQLIRFTLHLMDNFNKKHGKKDAPPAKKEDVEYLMKSVTKRVGCCLACGKWQVNEVQEKASEEVTVEAEDAFMCCSSCGTATYCNVECQRKDWPQHRGECHRFAKA